MTSVPFSKEIAAQFGITWIDPNERPNLPNQGLPGVCEWRPGVATANIGRTRLAIGQVHALSYAGVPQLAIKEWHPQDEVFAVFGQIVLGLSKTMAETADDVVWVILQPGIYIIRAKVIHIPPTSYLHKTVAPMVVLQGTTNKTEATSACIEHPRA